MVLKKTNFFVSGVTCVNCSNTVERSLKNTPGIHDPVLNSIESGRILVSVWMDEDISLLQLQQVIEMVGFEYSEIRDEPELASANLKHKLNIRRHWLLGVIGVFLGIAILLLMSCAGPLPVAVMIAVGVVSVLTTLVLSAEFLWKAKHQMQRAEPAMDTLFIMSTSLVIAVSIAAFFIPWLPMMFDVGLLVFGFRHLGLALKETLFEASGIKKNLQSNALEMVMKQQANGEYQPVHVSQIQPGDVIQIMSGEKMIPLDGAYIGPADIRPVLLKTHITGEILPAKLDVQEEILAGMILPSGSPPFLMRVSGVPAEVFSIMSVLPQASDFTDNQHVIIYTISSVLHAATVSGVHVQSKILSALSSEEIQRINSLLIPGEIISLPETLHAKILSQIPGFNAQQKTSSYLASIDQSIKNAERTKAKIQKDTEFFLQYFFIPVVLFTACLSAVLLSVYASPVIAIICAISVLVSACPCNLGIITPLAMFVGMKKAQGIKFQHADALEKASKVSTVIFDLNGTLTKGKPEVSFSSLEPDDLDIVFAMETRSGHPVGQAIARYAADHQSKLEIDCLPVFEADGVQAQIRDSTYVIGNANMMYKYNIVVPEVLCDAGTSIIYMAEINQLDIKYCGHMVLSDPLREHALTTVRALQQNSVEVHICTGADYATAQAYASVLGIKNIFAKSSIPGAARLSDKKSYVSNLIKHQKKIPLFVGDALNDAAALSFVRANGGVSMVVQHNHAAQAAAPGLLQCADVLIEAGSLLAVPRFLEVSQQTMSNIRWNLRANFAYNIVMTLLCAGVLVSLGVILHPAIGVMVMSAVFGLMLLSVLAFQRQSLTWLKSADVIKQPMSTNQGKGYAVGMFDRMGFGHTNADGTSSGDLLAQESGNLFSHGLN